MLKVFESWFYLHDGSGLVDWIGGSKFRCNLLASPPSFVLVESTYGNYKAPMATMN
jgi:hypothetical protein